MTGSCSITSTPGASSSRGEPCCKRGTRPPREARGQSATNIYAYAQYLYGVAIVATVDTDAPDSYLVEEVKASE